MDETLKRQITKDIEEHPILLYMKGTKEMPQCGFSAQVVAILKELNVPFDTKNVLTNPDLRSGMKEYSDWPTFPQLYIQGEFIGGCDIVCEMFATGELQKAVSALVL